MGSIDVTEFFGVRGGALGFMQYFGVPASQPSTAQLDETRWSPANKAAPVAGMATAIANNRGSSEAIQAGGVRVCTR
jgi:hypothetical protein